MLRLTNDITIGAFQFLGVHEVTTESGWELDRYVQNRRAEKIELARQTFGGGQIAAFEKRG